jgi:cell wall-associated NlpC family hydrolase
MTQVVEAYATRLVALRAAPGDAAEQVTQALPGEPLSVDERRGDWALVRTAYDYPGWVRAEALGSSGGPGWPPPPTDPDPVTAARAYLGTPYEWGGMTERGIDCSGLVHMSYRRIGRLVPRDADQQEAAGAPLTEDELRPGDLITYGDERTTHIAFWLGDGRILHSTERDGVDGVLEEPEPAELRARRRKLVRI